MREQQAYARYLGTEIHSRGNKALLIQKWFVLQVKLRGEEGGTEDGCLSLNLPQLYLTHHLYTHINKLFCALFIVFFPLSLNLLIPAPCPCP